MPGVVIDPTPNRFTQLSQVLGTYMNQLQQSDQADAQQQDAQDRVLASQFLKLPPDQQAANFKAFADQNPSAAKYILNTQGYTPHTPTAQEQEPEVAAQTKMTRDQAEKKIVSDALEAYQSGKPFIPDPVAVGTINPDLAGKQPFMSAAGQRYNYANAGQLPTNVEAAQETADKLVPTGNEDVVNAQNAPLKAAQTAEANAGVPLKQAQTDEARVKAEGERQSNAALGALGLGLTPGSSPTAAGSGQQSDINTAPPLIRAFIQRKADPMLLRYFKARGAEGLAQLNALEGQIQKYDPTFSMADYPKQVANLKEYSQAGQTGKSITAANTALRHMNTFLDDLSSMHNTRFGAYNAVANTLAGATGNQDIQKYSAQIRKDAAMVTNELAKASHGSSQFGEKEAQQFSKDLSENTTPAEGLGAVSGAIRLLAGRIQEIQASYKRDTGLTPPDWLSGARPILQKMKKLGVDGVDDLLNGDSGQPTAPTVSPDAQKVLAKYGVQ